MTRKFWEGKRVLLTGHTGFKGGWLSLWLQSMGAKVTGYALAAPTTPSLFDVCGVPEGMESVIGDVRELTHLRKVMVEREPQIIFHMAAQPLVRSSYEHPVETYSTNIMGTVNLLEAARSTRTLKAIINITSDKCYQNREWLRPYREDDPMGGFDPYSSSKGCAELITGAYRSSYFNEREYEMHGVAIATARAGNVIGGGDWAKDRLVPDLINAFANGHIPKIRNPEAVRPWQHVMEPLRGYLMLAERLFKDGPKYSGGWNFGPQNDDAKPVRWIVKRMAELWAKETNWERLNTSSLHEAQNLTLDNSKARNELGWTPVLQLESALELTINWVKKHQEGRSMKEVSLEQIKKYLKKCGD